MRRYFFVLLFLAQVPLAWSTQVYTNEVYFLTHLDPSYYLEDFTTYTDGYPFTHQEVALFHLYGPVNGYEWTASAGGGLYSLPGALSVNTATDLLIINFAAGGLPVTALGGIFTSTDWFGVPLDLLVTVTLSDGTTTTASLTRSGFLGFTSEVPITLLTIDGIDVDVGGDNQVLNFPALDHFYVGLALIPEPTSLALMSLGGLLLVSYRRYTRG